MTKKHFLTMSTIHKNDCVYDVKFAHTSKDMCNGKYVLMIGKITPKKSKTKNMKDIIGNNVEKDVQTNTSMDSVVDPVVKHEEEKVEIPLFMEFDRINRMYARSIEEISNMYARSIEKINRESESLNKKVAYKKKTTQKKSFYTLLNKIFK